MDANSLLDGGIEIAYQPIVQLGSGSVIAYEALARPRHPSASEPLSYFAALEAGGLRMAGEWAALRAAIEGAQTRPPRTKLFVNASPSTLLDPRFDIRALVELAGRHGSSPDDVVVEVTESEAIGDLDALAQRTQEMRRLGVGLAVDDAGAGHASFRVITRLRPSFIKLDRELVTAVDVDGARHAFVEAMVRFSRQIGSRLIAEGIETDGELISLAGLGVEAGQGFFLARPAVGELVSPSAAARRMIAMAAQRMRLGAAQVAVGDLVRTATFVHPTCAVAEAYRRFQDEPSLGVLVLMQEAGDRRRLVGQLTRRAMERRLATPGAWAELRERTVWDLADRQPLTVTASLDVIEVAGVIGARHPQEIADDVVVTGPRGDVVGVATVRDVVRALATVRPPGDLDVHPLSGLLGRAWVEAELARRLDAGEPTVMVVVDVDAFRRINDVGGFTAGDEVIRALGHSLGGLGASVQGLAVAHVGADDFMLLVPVGQHEEVVVELVHKLESEVVPLVRTVLGLHPRDRVAGELALSIAAVELTAAPPTGHEYLHWAQGLLSPLMQTAKGHEGHAWMHRTGGSTVLTTWTARRDGRRTISVGHAEPSAVRAALDLVAKAWPGLWAQADVPATSPDGDSREMERLLARYADPLRARAESAAAQGVETMEVSLEGEEGELIAMLDRVAVVTQHLLAGQRLPLPPELVVLDRLRHVRGRTLVRSDRASRTMS